MDKILIIYGSEGGIVEKMAQTVREGIMETDGFEVILKKAEEASQDDLRAVSGIAIGTPDYFDYMAGTVKGFFDRTFYPVQSKIRGSLTADLPCVLFASGGTGGEPALASLKKISRAFKFNIVDTVASGARFTEEVKEQSFLLGKRLAEEIKKRKGKSL
ncbi:MAG: flavodoxin [Candidatus Atribacteria bacterium]|nr:flavodoxin [Candidatus Atribacteria bacterium]